MDTGTDIPIEVNPSRRFGRPSRVTSSLVKQNGPSQQERQRGDLLEAAVNRSRLLVSTKQWLCSPGPTSQLLRTCAELTLPGHYKDTLFHLFHLHLMIQHLRD